MTLSDTKLLDSLGDPFTQHKTDEDEDAEDDDEESKQPQKLIYSNDEISNQLMYKNDKSILGS